MSTPAATTKPADAGTTVIEDSTCTFCGCVCDDIDITVKDNHIVDAKRACVLGKAWFYNHHADDRPSCLIEGRPATVEEGVERAARILTDAKYPIIYVLSGSAACRRRHR
jgi:formylmethanofuran dehydrogenase subunit B